MDHSLFLTLKVSKLYELCITELRFQSHTNLNKLHHLCMGSCFNNDHPALHRLLPFTFSAPTVINAETIYAWRSLTGSSAPDPGLGLDLVPF